MTTPRRSTHLFILRLMASTTRRINMNTNSYRRNLLRAAALAVVGITAGAGLTHAALTEVVDHDSMVIDGGHADFGAGFGGRNTGNNVPADPALITFSRDSTNRITASANGRTYLDRAPGSCARVKVEFLGTDSTVLEAAYGLDVCDPLLSGDVLRSPGWTVTSSPNAAIARVRVKTYIQSFGGEFTLAGVEKTVMDNN
jgi:hypothetical protein